MKDEALKLASALDHWATQMDMGRKPDPKSLTRKASEELRRLQAELDAIKQALAAPVQKPDAMGCKCAECGAWQRWTPSGMVCKNGHGGASGINQRLHTTPPAQPAPVPIKPIVDPDLDVNQRLAFKLGWKSAEEAHGITKGQP